MANAQALLASFLVHLGVELQQSRNTVAAYRRDLRRLLQGEKLPDREALLAHLAALRRTHAPASVLRATAAIRSFYRFLLAEGVLDVDPTEHLLAVRSGQRLPKAISHAAVERLLGALEGDGPLAIRDRALLLLLYATGARVSEATALPLSAFLPEHRFLRVHGKGDRERLVPLSDRACAGLLRYVTEVRPLLAARGGGRAEHLFLSRTGRPLERNRVLQLVRAAARTAGLHGCSPHSLRHSFATHLVAGGADLRSVQEMLGHASLATTQVYTKVDPSRLRVTHAKYHPRG
jgi:integrase/recombinase XerD